MPKLRHPDRLGLHVRVVLDNGIAIGPGKAELLEAIRETGSISAAGRQMGMSYRRAWTLIEELNDVFSTPVVDAAKGGAGGGGARLTPLGARLLAAYRTIEQEAEAAAKAELAVIRRALRKEETP
jgi:molybdate transport system regulatory protein